ncbi:MAG: RNA polymerase sigma factor [Candidatus Omnitrophica bacterium]|nr:RNA polymerase sigma factor [Candidatus Omnitrophota bacterium]
MNDLDKFIKDAVNGDVRAFEQIYKASASFVYNVAWSMLRNEHDAQEATQEVFMKVYKELKNFRFASSFKTWVYRITVNHVLNVRKSQSRYKNHEVMVEDENVIDHISDHKEQNKEDEQEMIMKMLDILDPQQKMCMVLRHLEGLSYQQVAEVTRMNLNTVRTHLKRSRELLIKKFPRKEVIEHEM